MSRDSLGLPADRPVASSRSASYRTEREAEINYDRPKKPPDDAAYSSLYFEVKKYIPADFTVSLSENRLIGGIG
jgi:hypothetical protein